MMILTAYWLDALTRWASVYREVALQNLYASMSEAALLDALEAMKPRALILEFPVKVA